MPGGADSSLEKKRREQRAALYRQLVEQVVKYPAEEIRALAIRQRDAFAKRLTDAKDTLGQLLNRWKSYEQDLFDAQWQLDQGDKLKSSTAEKDRQDRRRHYARAYVNLFGAADRLDEELADGSTATVILRDAVEKAESVVEEVVEKAESVVEKVADKVGDIGEKLDDTTTFLTIAAGVALVAFAYGRGKR